LSHKQKRILGVQQGYHEEIGNAKWRSLSSLFVNDANDGRFTSEIRLEGQPLLISISWERIASLADFG
jgi:hypothetical protein